MDTVFEQVIKSHLDERSHTDELFATKYSNPKKNAATILIARLVKLLAKKIE